MKLKLNFFTSSRIILLIAMLCYIGDCKAQNYFKRRFWSGQAPNGYSAYHINETASGGFILEGSMGSYRHGVLIKTDSYGNPLFYKGYIKTGYFYDYTEFEDLVINNDSTYLVIGKVKMPPASSGLLAKIDQDGHVMWSKTINNFSGRHGILKMEDSTIVLRLELNLFSDLILCNTDGFGNLTNTIRFEDSLGASIAIDKQLALPQNRIALAGYKSPGEAYFLLLDANMDVISSYSYPGYYKITEMIKASDSGFLCVLDNTAGNDTVFSILKLDSLGIPDWITTFSGASRYLNGSALVQNSDKSIYCGLRWSNFNNPNQDYGGSVMNLDSSGNLLGISDSLQIASFRQFKYTSDNRLASIVDDQYSFSVAPSLLITDSLFTLGSGMCLYHYPTFMSQTFGQITALNSPLVKNNYFVNTSPISLHDSIMGFSLLTCIQSENGCVNTSSALNISSCNSYTSPSGLYTWTNSGIYKDTILNAIGCDSIINIYLTILTIDEPVVVGDSLICQNDTSILSTSLPYMNYLWSNGSTDSIISVNTMGTYMVTVTAQNGCSGTGSYFVDVMQDPLVSITAQGSTTFCRGDSVVLSAPASLTSYQWYRWNNIIPGATSINYTAKIRGKYKCIAQNAALCSDTSNVIAVNVPCMPVDPAQERTITYNESQPQNFSISPNPGTGVFSIHSSPGQVRVFNVIGELILTKEITEKLTNLDLSDYPDGIYFFTLRNGGKLNSRKVILSH